MTMRKWQEHFTEILEVLSDGAVWKRADLIEAVSRRLELTEEEHKIRISSGGLMYAGRIGFAISHLKRVGAIESPARAQFRILEAGRQLLASHPGAVTMDVVKSALGDPDKPEKKHEENVDLPVAESENELVPVEQISAGIERNNKIVAADLLTRLHANTPAFSEQAVLDVLMAMGYGGTDAKPPAHNYPTTAESTESSIKMLWDCHGSTCKPRGSIPAHPFKGQIFRSS